jgi:hypothetical protein
MNKRLLLALYDRSGLGAYMPVDYKGHELEVEKHLEKFAQLIVRECGKIVTIWSDEEPCSEGYDITPVAKLKEHFGVIE